MRIPSSVRMVADVLGMDVAVRLTQATARNGHLSIPGRRVPESHKLRQILSPAEIEQAQHHFGGRPIPYATARGLKRAVRAQRRAKRCAELVDQGADTQTIAEALKCSRDVARVMRNRLKKRLVANSLNNNPCAPTPTPPLGPW